MLNNKVIYNDFLLEDKRFYVYAYLDIRRPKKYCFKEYFFDYEPFYIGKGKEARKDDHLYRALKQKLPGGHFGRIRKIKEETGLLPKIIVVKDCLTENEAFKLETDIIKTLGRIIFKTGPLFNKSDGGGGKSGIKISERHSKIISLSNSTRPKLSEEARQRISIKHTGRKISQQQYLKLCNRPICQKSVLGMKNANLERKVSEKQKIGLEKGRRRHSPEVIKRQGEKATRKYRVVTEKGNEFVVTNIRQWAGEKFAAQIIVHVDTNVFYKGYKIFHLDSKYKRVLYELFENGQKIAEFNQSKLKKWFIDNQVSGRGILRTLTENKPYKNKYLLKLKNVEAM